jgi:hypothetical protein
MDYFPTNNVSDTTVSVQPLGSNRQPPRSNQASLSHPTQRLMPTSAYVASTEGQYLAPNSGAAFLERAWGRLHEDKISTIPFDVLDSHVPQSSIFALGDKPFSKIEQNDAKLPPQDHASQLAAIYFDFAVVTYRFLHRGTVEDWLSCLYSENAVRGFRLSNARKAILFSIFAISTSHNQASSTAEKHSYEKRSL